MVITWSIPAFVWLDQLSLSSQLVLIIFYFVTALAGTIVRHTDPLGSLTSPGLALPACAYALWRADGAAAMFPTAAVLGGWLSVVALGWSLRLAYADRERLRAERSLLVEQLSGTLEALDTAHVAEQKAREAADKANRDKSRFLAHVSHDLRQPVHAAYLLLESLPDDHAPGPDESAQIGQVRRSIANLAEMFDALLDTAMLESGQNRVAQRPVQLNALFQRLSEEFGTRAEREGIDLRLHASDYVLNTDPILISRMVRNLIVNALEHASGSRILVGPRWRSDGLYIEVRDNGAGIDAADFEKIFEEFQSLDKQGEIGHGQNRGLGLSIVQRLCRVLNCRASLWSERGNGSRFVIGPFRQSDTGAAKISSTPVAGSALRALRILFVDDDPNTLLSLSALLKKWGHEVDCRSNCDLEGLSKPDLVIADFNLGQGLTGLDVIGEARRLWDEDLPALVVTGETDAAVKQSIQSAGLMCLPKPVKPAALKSAILSSGSRPGTETDN